jgi:chromosome segregation ATPase
MSETLIITVIGALVILIPSIIGFRTTSFNEIRGLLTLYKEQIDVLERQLDELREERKAERCAYDKTISEMKIEITILAEKNNALERQIDNYERYVLLLIERIKALGGVPPVME